MRSFTTLILASTLTLGGCSLFTVKAPEQYGNKCTRSSYSPWADTVGVAMFGGASAISLAVYNSEPAYDPHNFLTKRLGRHYALLGAFALLYGVSAYEGFSVIKLCEKHLQTESAQPAEPPAKRGAPMEN